jgi:hypothetical protein
MSPVLEALIQRWLQHLLYYQLPHLLPRKLRQQPTHNTIRQPQRKPICCCKQCSGELLGVWCYCSWQACIC